MTSPTTDERTPSTSPRALLVGVAGLMLALGLLQSLIGVRGTIEQYTDTTLGLVMSAYFVGFLVGSVAAPRLVHRAGHVRSFAALASPAAAMFLLHGALVHPLAWLGLRAAAGFCIAGLLVVAESWLNGLAGNHRRGHLLARYTVVTFGAFGIGQFLLNLADPATITLFVLGSVLISFAVVPVSLTRLPTTGTAEGRPVTLATTARTAPLALAGTIACGLGQSALLSLGAIYATQAGLSLAFTSTFMAAVLLGAAAVTIPLGRWSDHVDRRQVIAGTAWAAALVALTAAPVGADRPWLLVLAGGALGATTLPLYPISLAHLGDRLQPDEVVSASSKLVMAYAIGATAGPLLASTLMSAVGPAGFWWYQAALLALLGAYAAYRLSHLAPVEVKGEYAPVPSGATPMILGPDVDTDDTLDGAPRWVEAAGPQLALRELGEGEVVVLVHGLAGSGRLWHHQRRSLARRGYRAVSYDLRGHGDSASSGSYHLSDHVADLQALVEGLDSGPVHLVGSGFGGLVALDLSAARPDLVRSVTLVGNVVIPPPHDRPSQLGGRVAMLLDRVATGLLGWQRTAWRLASHVYDPDVHPDRHRLLVDTAAATSPHAFWQGRRDLLRWRRADVDLPLRLVVGAQDPTTPAELAELHGRVPVITVDGAGLLPQLDNPHAVNDALAAKGAANPADRPAMA